MIRPDPSAPLPAEAGVALELRRRDAFRAVFGAAAASLVGLDAMALPAAAPQFLHGVASGDPDAASVVLWTRVTQSGTKPVMVDWKLSSTADMATPVAQGSARALAAGDYTVKVIPNGLTAGATYWYQFSCNGVVSPIGRTRTLPDANSTAEVNLAIFSCSNFEKGYFNAYGEAAKDDSLFGMFHLGDYTYEYGLGGYQTTALALNLVTEPRKDQLLPTTETTTLAAYRTRQALYHTDPQLQAAHQNFPWFAIYDDHESANDSWTGGAENHTPATEGDWQSRKQAALQAWYEWMPVRNRNPRFDANGNPQKLFHFVDFGKVARLVLLDSRLAGRDQQLTSTAMGQAYGYYAQTGSWALDTVSGRPRSLLGAQQEAWVDGALAHSKQTWQLVGNQTLLHYQIAPDFLNAPGLTDAQRAGISGTVDAIFGAGAGAQFGQLGALGLPNPATNDSWNGYPTARNRFYASLLKAKNPVVLTGDSHNAWAANLAVGPTKVGVEFGATSVTSPGYEQTFPGLPAATLGALITYSSQTKSQTDKLQWCELANRGYLKVSANTTQLTATFVFVSTAFSTSYTTSTKTFTVNPGARQATAVTV